MSNDLHTRARQFESIKTIRSRSTLRDRLHENSRNLNDLLYGQSPFKKKDNPNSTSSSSHSFNSVSSPSSSIQSELSVDSNSKLSSKIDITFSSISPPTATNAKDSVRPNVRSSSDLLSKQQNVSCNSEKSMDINSNVRISTKTQRPSKRTETKIQSGVDNSRNSSASISNNNIPPKNSNSLKYLNRTSEQNTKLHFVERKNEPSSSYVQDRIQALQHVKKDALSNRREVPKFDHSNVLNHNQFLPVDRNTKFVAKSSSKNNQFQCPSDSAIETESGSSFSSAVSRLVHPENTICVRNSELLLGNREINGNDVFSPENESWCVVTATRENDRNGNINAKSVPVIEGRNIIEANSSNVEDNIERELEEIIWTTVPIEGSRRVLKSNVTSRSRSSNSHCLLITPDLLVDDTAPDTTCQTMSELEKMIAKKYQQKRGASPHHRKQLHIIRRPQSVPAKGRAFYSPAAAASPVLTFTENKGLSLPSDTNANEPLYANTMGSCDVIQKPPRPNTRRYVKRNSKLNPEAIVNNSNSNGFQTYKRDSDKASVAATERTSRRDHIKNIQRLFEVSSKDVTIQTSNPDISKSFTDTKDQSSITLTKFESIPDVSPSTTPSPKTKDVNPHASNVEEDDDPNVQMDEIFSRPKTKFKKSKLKNILKHKKGKYHPSMEDLSNLNETKIHAKFKSMPNISNSHVDSEFCHSLSNRPNGKLSFSVVDIGDIDKLDDILTKNHFGNTEFDQFRKSKNKKSGAKSLDDMKKLFSSEPSLSFRRRTDNQFKGSTKFSSATTEYHTSLVTGIVNDDTLSDINPDIFDSDVAGSTDIGIFQSSDQLSTEQKKDSSLDVSNNSRLSFLHSVCNTPEPRVIPEKIKTKTSSQIDLDKSEPSESFTIDTSQITALKSTSVTKLDLGSLNEESVDDISSISSLSSDQKSLQSRGFVFSDQPSAAVPEIKSGQNNESSSVLNITFSVDDQVSSCSSISQLESLKDKRKRLVKMDSVRSSCFGSSVDPQDQNLEKEIAGSEYDVEEQSMTLSIEPPSSFTQIETSLPDETETTVKGDTNTQKLKDESPLYATVQKPFKNKKINDQAIDSGEKTTKTVMTPVQVRSPSTDSVPFSPPYATVRDCVDSLPLTCSPPYATIEDCLEETKSASSNKATDALMDDSVSQPYATIKENQADVKKIADTSNKFGLSPTYATLEECKNNGGNEIVEDSVPGKSSQSTTSPLYAALEDCGKTECLATKPPINRISSPIYSTVAECSRQVNASCLKKADIDVESASSHYASVSEINAQRPVFQKSQTDGDTSSNVHHLPTTLPQSSSQFSLYQSIDQVRQDKDLDNYQKGDSGIQMESQSVSCDPNDDSNLSAATGGSENKEDLYAKVGNFRKKGAGVEVVSMTRSSSDEADLTLFSDDEHGGPPLPARRYKQDSTLKSSKGFSSSKSSLLNKMGAIKNSTKSKIKSFRKAVSLERGLDNVETIETPSKAEKLEKSKTKMRKAPSLKSLTALFGKKSKSKKEKTDQVLSVFDDSSERLASKGSTLSLSKKKLWSSAKSLETDNVEAPTMLRTIGKLLEINQDGNHIIELTKPPHGPIGFYIGRGTANYDYGIFVSRFSDVSLEKLFAGLMNVGDEILEINQRPVQDLSLDDAYELMAARNKLVLKVFPLSSRRDL